jgi:uncharacterized membrane protein
MRRIKSFLKTSLLGGLIVILPVGIIFFLFKWVFDSVEAKVAPLTQLVLQRWNLPDFIAMVVVLGLIVLACFVIGLVVRTQVGRFFHEKLEDHILKIAPGYNLIKETVLQFLGNRPSPFSSVALVRIFGNDTLVTAFVTETHDNGWFSVFVPTGPNPTSGNIYHLQPQYVHRVDLPIEDVMRSIISCGAGSATVVKAYLDTQPSE